MIIMNYIIITNMLTFYQLFSSTTVIGFSITLLLSFILLFCFKLLSLLFRLSSSSSLFSLIVPPIILRFLNSVGSSLLLLLSLSLSPLDLLVLFSLRFWRLFLFFEVFALALSSLSFCFCSNSACLDSYQHN